MFNFVKNSFGGSLLPVTSGRKYQGGVSVRVHFVLHSGCVSFPYSEKLNEETTLQTLAWRNMIDNISVFIAEVRSRCALNSSSSALAPVDTHVNTG